MLNKLIVSHSSSVGDKLQASDSEVHNRKARNCQGGVTECTELRSTEIKCRELRLNQVFILALLMRLMLLCEYEEDNAGLSRLTQFKAVKLGAN